MQIGLDIDWVRRRFCLTEPFIPKIGFQLGAPSLVGEDPPDLGFVVQGESMNVVLPDTHQFPITIAIVDAKGNPAEVEGVPVWASTDESVAVVQPASDGKSAVVAAVGPLGTAQITVTADADLGDGVSNIAGLLDVTVIASAAVGITVQAGPTEPQPA